MSLKQFRFYVENLRSGDKVKFIGDGHTLDEAWKDARKNIDASDEAKPVSVKTRAGAIISKTIHQFNNDEAPAAPAEDSFE